MLHLMHQLEIDITQSNEVGEAIELAHIYRMPAVVVHPELVDAATIQRFRRQATCKIIVPVDWPKGDKTGISKLYNMSLTALACDGVEILFNSRDVTALTIEMKTLINFIRTQLPEIIEIRFVFGALTHDTKWLTAMCEAAKNVPAPNFIRTDIATKAPQVKANATVHADTITLMKSIVNRPIKLSGNIGSTKMLAQCKANRYAVSLKQAQMIVKEIKENPKKVEKLFAPV